MPNNHPLAKAKTVSPKQLEAEQVLLLGEGHCFRTQVLEACPSLRNHIAVNSGSLQSTIEGSSLETLKYMVASGLGVTILPASAAQFGEPSSSALVTRPLNTTTMKRTVALAWRASFPRHKAIDVLSQTIRLCELGNAITLEPSHTK